MILIDKIKGEDSALAEKLQEMGEDKIPKDIKKNLGTYYAAYKILSQLGISDADLLGKNVSDNVDEILNQ